MRTIKWSLGIGLAGCKNEGEFAVADDTADEEIEEMAKEAAFNDVDWNWWEEV